MTHSGTAMLRTAPVIVLGLLAACSDRLDGEAQPNPFETGEPVVRASEVGTPAAAQLEAEPAAGETIYAEASEEDFAEDPATALGFDPAPMDDAAGFDPTPQGFGEPLDE